jgi:hypothetical protein
MPTYIIYYDSGDSRGPFNIFLSGSYGLSPYASNVTKQQLQGGYSITVASNVNSSSAEVYDISVGCSGVENLPFPSPSPSRTPSVTVTPSITPSISVTPSITPSFSRTPSVTPSYTAQPSRTPSYTPTTTPSKTPGVTQSVTPTVTMSRTPSITPSPITCYNIEVGYDSADRYTACNNYNYSETTYVGSDTNDLTTATLLYTACGRNIAAQTGYYSNGVITRYWTGTTFTTQFDCIA